MAYSDKWSAVRWFLCRFFFCKELSRDEQNMIKSQHAGHTCLVLTSCEFTTLRSSLLVSLHALMTQYFISVFCLIGDPHTLSMSSQVSHMYLYDVFVKLKTVHWCEKNINMIKYCVITALHTVYTVNTMYEHVCMKYLEAYSARYLIKAIKTHNFVRVSNILFWVRFSSSVLALNMKI